MFFKKDKERFEQWLVLATNNGFYIESIDLATDASMLCLDVKENLRLRLHVRIGWKGGDCNEFLYQTRPAGVSEFDWHTDKTSLATFVSDVDKIKDKLAKNGMG